MATLDTLQDAVNSLTTSTTTLVNEVQVKKATLDASVADAETAQTAAAASATTASGHATSAAASAAAAAATASGIAGFDLDAISQVKAVTAVDVFVYDTSKDSDGGAWRKRTQHTSWYNETLNTATRGSRREFPAVAVIVAEATKVTIYDGDDPALPMWMVFDGGSLTDMLPMSVGSPNSAIYALNGKISVTNSGGSYGFGVIDLMADNALRFRASSAATYSGYYNGGISKRNDGSLWDGTDPLGIIVNDAVNDVAMTVLPNSPIDPATGLPVPTIAVATAGGVSVIKDDGTVVDSAYTGAVGKVVFTETGIWYIRNQSTYVFSFATYDDISAGDGFGDAFGRSDGAGDIDLLVSGHKGLEALDNQIALAGNTISSISVPGLMLHQPSYADQSKGVSALLTSTYNTGWMNGDIKGAFLSSTDATSLVGSGELVTNGTFDTDTAWTKGTGWTISGGVASFDTSVSGAGIETALTQNITTVVGKTYIVKATFSSLVNLSGSELLVRCAGTNLNAWETGSPNILTDGTYTFSFVATSTTTEVNIRASVLVEGDETGSVDNVSVKLADADRSVNNNGLIVNGTVTRSAVATGAELVAYSGFSASNYLEQPYNSALDFGTGDFCVMGWFKLNGLVTDVLVSRKRVTPNRFIIQTAAGALQYLSSSVSLTTSQTFGDNTFRHFAVVRNNGTTTVYVNGVALLSGTDAGDVNSGNPLFVGINEDLGAALAGSLTLLRISATAPTAEQIKKIYEDEKVLFQENAACTLYGASDAVTALAHDSDTGLLHVGTSAGRSVFQGLRRVSNTTTAVGTAISASNGLVVEE